MREDLPRYRCHKVVQAAKITDVELAGLMTARLILDGAEEGVVMKNMWVEKNSPGFDPKSLGGGYLVRYADGYESWSPADAFEEGYTLIDD